MKKNRFVLLLLWAVTVASCSSSAKEILTSPDSQTTLCFELSEQGVPFYNVVKEGDTIIRQSALGLWGKGFRLDTLLRVSTVERSTFDQTWTTVWGQSSSIRNHYNELKITLINPQQDSIDITFRLFDQGIGFRYCLRGEEEVILQGEKTQFNMTDNHTTWWAPGCVEEGEYIFQKVKINQISPALCQGARGNNAHYMPRKPYPTGMSTPATFETVSGRFVSIHEAALYNYPGMCLNVNPSDYKIQVEPTPFKRDSSVIAIIKRPFDTPWRTIVIGDQAGDLILSNLILNLNEPCKIEDTSWIKPMKYMGVWWDMHLETHAWDDRHPTLPHGATTQRIKEVIDFAAENGIPGVLVEGWNKGWHHWKDFDYVQPASGVDVEAVTAYAQKRNIDLIWHHETGCHVNEYIAQMDTAYKYMQERNIHAVKTGYVGFVPDHYHYEQWMVNHYNETVIKGAQHQVMLDIHECIHPTGIARTYPNLMSGEAIRGIEYTAWGYTPVDQNCITPFTRNLAGPMDYTPGIFDLLQPKNRRNIEAFKKDPSLDKKNPPYRVNTTIVQQLALYVVFYSPIQMLADIPQSYRNHPLFPFLKSVPVDWQETKVLSAEIGEHVVIARKGKDSNDWYIGGISGGQAIEMELPLDFLSEGTSYQAIIYKDGKDADWKENPLVYKIETQKVNKETTLALEMAKGGGFAIEIRAL